MRFCENFLKETKIATEKQHRINREITTPEIRLIGADGEPIGVVKIAEALRLAEESELDLVEIAPTAAPPVCRIMDYGKSRGLRIADAIISKYAYNQTRTRKHGKKF